MKKNIDFDVKMHPFLKYPGGKSKEIPLVLKYLPNKVNRYIEPFVGGGSIYFAMNIQNSFINDKSYDLYLVYKFIKNQNTKFKQLLLSFDNYWRILSDVQVDELEFNEGFFDKSKLIDFYKYARNKKNKTIEKINSSGSIISSDDLFKIEITARKTAFYMCIRELYNTIKNDDLLHAACFYFLREYCYSSMFRFSKTGDFNVPYGGMSYNEKYMSEKINYMFSKEMKDYFRNTSISNDDFETFLNKVNLKDDDFIFLDPPYDSDFSTYDNNPFDKSEQIRLKDFLACTKASWMLIIKKTDFIYELYKNFNIYEYDMNYMVSFKNRNDKDVKHLLITNYKLRNEVK